MLVRVCAARPFDSHVAFHLNVLLSVALSSIDGQTGTGKTFTMEGKSDDENLRGIVPRSFHYIFESVDGMGKNMEFLVRASFLEVTNSKIPENSELSYDVQR